MYYLQGKQYDVKFTIVQLYLLQHINVYDEAATENRTHRKQLCMAFSF
jgi:hypothetical protein